MSYLNQNFVIFTYINAYKKDYIHVYKKGSKLSKYTRRIWNVNIVRRTTQYVKSSTKNSNLAFIIIWDHENAAGDNNYLSGRGGVT